MCGPPYWSSLHLTLASTASTLILILLVLYHLLEATLTNSHASIAEHRWPEAIPMTDATAESCDSALLSGWVSRYGVPTTITSDLGSQFDSALWQSLMNLLGKHNRTAAYHPQANGFVARFHHPQGRYVTHLSRVSLRHYNQAARRLLLTTNL